MRGCRRYAEGGLEGLADRSHRPRSCPHQMAAGGRGAVWSSCAGCIRVGVPTGCVYRAGAGGDRPGAERGRRSAGRWSGWAWPCPGRRRGRGGSTGGGSAARPMELWQLDVMGGVLLADGEGAARWSPAIDDHSRFCVAVGLVERATSRAVCGVFARSWPSYGVPEEVLTDNGKVFTGRFAPGRSRCCSTGSAGRTASTTCSPRRGHRPPPARSSGSTGPCAGVPQRPRRSPA